MSGVAAEGRKSKRTKWNGITGTCLVPPQGVAEVGSRF